MSGALLSRKAVAIRLGVTEPTVRKLAERGQLTQVWTSERRCAITEASLNHYLMAIGAEQAEPAPAA